MTTAEVKVELMNWKLSNESVAEIANEIEADNQKRAKRKARLAKKQMQTDNLLKSAAKAAMKAAPAKKAAKPAKVVASKKAAAKKTNSKIGPTQGILDMMKRRKNGVTTAEVHAAFPTTRKSDILTRLARKKMIIHIETGQWRLASK